MDIKYINNNIILSEPYEDKKTGYIIIPKQVLLNGYIDKVGDTINFNETKMKVLSVKVTEKTIEVELEDVK